MPVVRLPAPDDDINLVVGDKFRLITQKIIAHSM
jgi:hypothetical protein